MMQTKLTKEQIGKLKQARNGIFNGFIYSDTDEGGGYWREVTDKLDAKIHHGTSDGKPYIEPEPLIPEGYRKANADEWRRKDVKYWDLRHKDWRPRLLQGVAFDPPVMQTRYIVPIDPPLTDEDACVWPRLLVMVRNKFYDTWEGPFQYVGRTNVADDDIRYSVWDKSGYHRWYTQVRPATPEEIEAAK